MRPFYHMEGWLKDRGIQLSHAEMNIIAQHTTIRTAKGKELLMQQDEPVTKFYFLNSGIIRLFRMHEGIDYTLGLIDSHDFLSAPQLITTRARTTCSLETLTDCELLEWDMPQFERIKEKLSAAYTIETELIVRLTNWVQQNQIEMICYPAEKRYQLMLERQPQLLLQIPLKYIASYLGIHQDSLSRIRKANLPPGKK